MGLAAKNIMLAPALTLVGNAGRCIVNVCDIGLDKVQEFRGHGISQGGAREGGGELAGWGEALVIRVKVSPGIMFLVPHDICRPLDYIDPDYQGNAGNPYINLAVSELSTDEVSQSSAPNMGISYPAQVQLDPTMF
ncbi:hypothetical protein Bbelb_059140 [Branchiostoma belcheri]|nr:hypothetical protein Bbelb_059140 [Branchiostoma belcheri]